MTYRIKVQVRRKNTIRSKVLVRFTSALTGRIGIFIEKLNGNYFADLDYSHFGEIQSFDPSGNFVAVWDPTFGFQLVSLASLQNNSTASVRIVTETGDITVGPNTRLLIMNRDADESPSKINLPASAGKVGGIKIVDWKGNAGTFPHDVYPAGTEKFNAVQAVWHINGDGASIVCDPIPTLGYAI